MSYSLVTAPYKPNRDSCIKELFKPGVILSYPNVHTKEIKITEMYNYFHIDRDSEGHSLGKYYQFGYEIYDDAYEKQHIEYHEHHEHVKQKIQNGSGDQQLVIIGDSPGNHEINQETKSGALYQTIVNDINNSENIPLIEKSYLTKVIQLLEENALSQKEAKDAKPFFEKYQNQISGITSILSLLTSIAGIIIK